MNPDQLPLDENSAICASKLIVRSFKTFEGLFFHSQLQGSLVCRTALLTHA